jgi:hypothetical protein
MVIPFVSERLGWHHTCRDDGQDSDGPLRQAPSRSLRPTGGCRVGVRARPTDHYQDSPHGTSAGRFGSDQARAPTLTLTASPLELVDRQRLVLILAAGSCGAKASAKEPSVLGVRRRPRRRPAAGGSGERHFGAACIWRSTQATTPTLSDHPWVAARRKDQERLRSIDPRRGPREGQPKGRGRRHSGESPIRRRHYQWRRLTCGDSTESIREDPPDESYTVPAVPRQRAGSRATRPARLDDRRGDCLSDQRDNPLVRGARPAPRCWCDSIGW